jgi:DNA-binding NtrC family response regulator
MESDDMSEIILFVDDEENVLNSITRAFYDTDLRIVTVTDAAKALAALRLCPG